MNIIDFIKQDWIEYRIIQEEQSIKNIQWEIAFEKKFLNKRKETLESHQKDLNNLYKKLEDLNKSNT